MEHTLLAGQVPDGWWDLTNMRMINAYQKRLSRAVSPNIKKFLNLTLFAFLEADVASTIPTAGGLLTLQTSLQLTVNDMRGTLPTLLGEYFKTIA